MREAARHTRWTAPDAQFEVAVQAAIDVAFDDHTVSARWTRLLATLGVPPLAEDALPPARGVRGVYGGRSAARS